MKKPLTPEEAAMHLTNTEIAQIVAHMAEDREPPTPLVEAARRLEGNETVSYTFSVLDGDIPDYEESRDEDGYKHPWWEIAEVVRQARGKWVAFDGDFHSGVSNRIRQGRPAPFAPAGTFEASARNAEPTPTNVKGRPTKLYIRYIGGEGMSAP